MVKNILGIIISTLIGGTILIIFGLSVIVSMFTLTFFLVIFFISIIKKRSRFL